MAALDQLVERSLVMRAPNRRYVLLETLRAFGAEQLIADGRVDVVGEHHARHHVEWIEAADRRMMESAHHGNVTEIDAALPELRAALEWLLVHEDLALAGRLVRSSSTTGCCDCARRRRLGRAGHRRRPRRSQSRRAGRVGRQRVRGVDGWRRDRGRRPCCQGSEIARAARRSPPPEVCMLSGNSALFQGRLDEATTWYERGRVVAVDDPAQRLMAASTRLLPLAYSGDPTAAEQAADVLAEVGEATTPYAAYVWYCAGEADLAVDHERARARFGRALELAELTNASFVAGVAGRRRRRSMPPR